MCVCGPTNARPHDRPDRPSPRPPHSPDGMPALRLPVRVHGARQAALQAAHGPAPQAAALPALRDSMPDLARCHAPLPASAPDREPGEVDLGAQDQG